jgi:hypothetical protein
MPLDRDLDPAAPHRRPVGHVEGNALKIVENAKPHCRHSFLHCASYAIALVRFPIGDRYMRFK